MPSAVVPELTTFSPWDGAGERVLKNIVNALANRCLPVQPGVVASACQSAPHSVVAPGQSQYLVENFSRVVMQQRRKLTASNIFLCFVVVGPTKIYYNSIEPFTRVAHDNFVLR